MSEIGTVHYPERSQGGHLLAACDCVDCDREKSRCRAAHRSARCDPLRHRAARPEATPAAERAGPEHADVAAAVDGCQCRPCRLLRQEGTIRDLMAEKRRLAGKRDELAAAAVGLRASLDRANADLAAIEDRGEMLVRERDMARMSEAEQRRDRHRVAEHRDRLVEEQRKLRAELEGKAGSLVWYRERRAEDSRRISDLEARVAAAEAQAAELASVGEAIAATAAPPRATPACCCCPRSPSPTSISITFSVPVPDPCPTNASA